MLAFVAFASGIGLFGAIESEFFPVFDHGEFTIRFRTAPDASIQETRGRLEEVLRVLKGYPEVDHTYAAIAPGEGDTVQMGMVYVHLTPKDKRERSQQQLMPDMRVQLQKIPGLVVSIQEDPDSPQKPLQLLVRGDEIAKLKEYAAQIKRQIYAVPGIVDVEATLEQDLPEVRLIVDRERARSSGVGTDAIVRTVGALVGGTVVSTYEDEAGEAIDVRIRLPENLRQDVRQVADLRLAVPGPSGISLVPIADLVRIERSVSPSQITRQDMSRQVALSANLDGIPLGTAAQKSLEAASTVSMSPGYSVRVGGDTEMMEESFGYLFEALILAVIFVYLILAAQFESFIDPLAIMLSLPLSIVGMAGTLILTRDTLNIISLIGLILLMGLVTKNAILLIDYAKVLRGRGLDRRTALVDAGRTRLRPIMMTTLAMIFGMLPLALGIGQGAEMRAPMARAVIGGLITSTLLTLIVVPVVYSLLDDFAAWLHRKWSGKKKEEELQPFPPELEPSPEPAGVARGIIALIVLLAAAPMVAQETPLTLDEALQIAIAKNRDLQKAHEYRRWVQGRYVEERSAALPHLQLTAGGVESWDNTYQLFFGPSYPASQRTWSTNLGLTQTLYSWGKIGAAIEIAKQGIASAEDLLDLSRAETVRVTTEAFVDVLLARSLETIAADTLAQRERHLDEAKKKYELGVATDYDVLSATVAVDNARPDVIHAANLVRTATQRLRLVLGETELERDVAGSLEMELIEPPQVPAVIEEARANRPDLLELEHRLAVYEQLVKIAGADDKPSVELRAGYGWMSLAAGSLDGSTRNWNAGVYLSFPFFDGFRTTGRTMAARSDLAQQRIDAERARDEVRLQAQTAVDAVREAQSIVRALTGTVDQAHRLLRMAEEGYALGVKTQIEVQDAQLNVRAAEANLARARRDLRVATVNLDWVRGAL